MAKDSDQDKMNEESISFLEEVKKGKPRKFAMICKGPSIVSLIVYKKGNVESRKKEAKESGKGQFYHGVVDGQGANIRFVLARADGFEEAPVKTSVLKGYLDEAAELKCKPVFEIVDVAPEIADDDEPAQNVAEPLQNNQEPPPVPPPPPQSQATSDVDEARRKKLEEALSKLVPKLKEAVASFPDRKVELLTPVASIKKHLEAGQLNEAQEQLVSLGQLLKSVLTAGANTTSTNQDTASTTQDATPQSTTNDPTGLQGEFNQKMNEVQALYEQAKANKAGDLGKMQNFLAAAWGKAETGEYATAIKVLDRLRELVNEALSSNAPSGDLGIEKGIVAKRTFLLTRFKELPLQIRPMLDELHMELIASGADEDPAQIISGLNAALQTLFDEIQKEVNESINAGNSGMLEGLKSRVLSNQFVQILVGNPLMDGTEIQTAIIDALDEIEQQMTA